MNPKHWTILTAFLILVTLLSGCPAANTPTEPGPGAPMATSTPTFTPTITGTLPPTNTATFTSTSTPSFTPTNTPSSTSTRTDTPTATPSFTTTHTPTNTLTATPTFTPTATETFTLTPTPSVVVNFAQLFAPPFISTSSGEQMNPIDGQVYHPGSTDTTTCPAPGMEAQAGYGTPSTNPNTWTSWFPMDCLLDGGNDDFYRVFLPAPAPGSYDFGVRFRLNGGAWTYGDYNGSTNGFTQPGIMTVAASAIYSKLQFPLSQGVTTGNSTADIFGRVYIAGYTEAAGPNGAVEGQLGYGPAGTNPAGPAWTWSAVSYNTQVVNEDEYLGTFNAPAPGLYDYAYRFRVNAGPWAYGDADNNQNGYSPAQAGQLTVY